MASRRIAVTGTHGSGKTAICYELVSRLKIMGLNAGLAREMARSSHYAISGTVAIELEIEILGMQIAEEMEAGRTLEVVVCDRCIVDTVAYCRHLFGKSKLPQAEVYRTAIEEFARIYSNSYDAIFKTSRWFELHDEDDRIAVRQGWLQEEVDSCLEDVLRDYGIVFYKLPTDREVEFIVEVLVEKNLISHE